jgi:tRNA (adenine57-N1/adenine58-N1)-methyltransferase
VCRDGFTVEDTVDSGTLPIQKIFGTTDLKPDLFVFFSVFLDLPAPWDAVEHAKKALRVRIARIYSLKKLSLSEVSPQKDRISRICCFSPCMEQVLRTFAALNDAGFTGEPHVIQNADIPSNAN